MTEFGDFTNQGYQVIRELGHNFTGGRVTYLAESINTAEKVVIKEFQFARSQTNWSGYQAHEREIEILQGLNHRGIPRYLDSFETDKGFCLVQEYKNAQSLAIRRSFDPQEIKKIAVAVLEILVYLQNRIPPIIHRDIKPENILVDHDLNVYLIDFGFARLGSHEISLSSAYLGTPGFIPPEQIRKPIEASDLYALGATLICLLTGKKSYQIQELTSADDPYQLEFKHLLQGSQAGELKLSLRFLAWLDKMVQPKLSHRYSNAEEALAELKPLDLIRVPEANLDNLVLEFTADKLGQKLSQTLKINNSIPETVLEGKWEVATNNNDPETENQLHSWISFNPPQFASNELECRITINTKELKAETNYERQLLLRNNSAAGVIPVTIKLKTASIPGIEKSKPPFVANQIIIFMLALMIPFVSEYSWYYHRYLWQQNTVLIEKIKNIWRF